MLVVGTVRTGEQHDDEALLAELALEPGGAGAAAGAAVGRGDRGDRRAAGSARRRRRCSPGPATGPPPGNPLLLRQLLRALEADGVRPDAAHADTVRGGRLAGGVRAWC